MFSLKFSIRYQLRGHMRVLRRVSMVRLTGQISETGQNTNDRSNDRSWPVRFETLSIWWCRENIREIVVTCILLVITEWYWTGINIYLLPFTAFSLRVYSYARKIENQCSYQRDWLQIWRIILPNLGFQNPYLEPWSWPRFQFWNRFQLWSWLTGHDHNHWKPCFFPH